MKKLFFPTLLAIAFVALVLRVVVCLQLADSPEVASPGIQTDMATYLRLAQDIRLGYWPDHFDYQPFYYTVILPFLLPASGTKLFLLAFQALVGAGTVLLAGLCAARIYGKRFGWLAAMLLALSRFHIFYTPFALYEVLQGFWLALLLYLTLLAWRRNRLWLWAADALVLSAAILTRGNAILLLPVLLAAAVARNWRMHRRRAAWLTAVIIALAYIPQLPYAIRNYQYAGHWCGPSTAGAKVLVLGNSPEAPAAGLAYPFTYSNWVSQDENGSRSAMRNILAWALENPMAFLELKFRTALHFWDADEIPNNVNIRAHGFPFSPLLTMPFLLDFGLFAPMAFAGLFIALKRKSPARRILMAFTLVFFAATVMFYMLARFRIACVPLLCILATGPIACIAQLAPKWRTMTTTQRQRRLAAILAAVAAGALLVHGALFCYRFGYEPDVTAAISPDGTCVTSPGGAILVHDHGPLPMGVGGATQLHLDPPEQPVRIEKRFAVPRKYRDALNGRPFTARLMVASSPELRPDAIFLHHGLQSKPATAVRLYAFSTFVQADFDAMAIAPDGTVTVGFDLPASQAQLAVVDILRNFQRTAIQTTGQSTRPAWEAFAEIQARLTP